MLVLAVDTGGAACSATLWRDGVPLATASLPLRHGHAERLVGLIDGLLAETGLRYATLDLLAASTGPGAFTGLRVGLATLGGIGLAIGRRIVGVPSFEVAAAAARAALPDLAGWPIAVVLDSRRAELFAQIFDPRPGAPLCLGPAALAARLPGARLILAGDGAGTVAPLLPDGTAFRLAATGPLDTAILAGLAAERADEAQDDPPAPLYLRAPDAAAVPQPRRPDAPGA